MALAGGSFIPSPLLASSPGAHAADASSGVSGTASGRLELATAELSCGGRHRVCEAVLMRCAACVPPGAAFFAPLNPGWGSVPTHLLLGAFPVGARTWIPRLRTGCIGACGLRTCRPGIPWVLTRWESLVLKSSCLNVFS